ncbi:SDR family oxidoreductase [Leptospira langatensis]|uniref:SDR family oxidoreductase n=1 Tax=Leptospira langatensis TaxID=2484983 RepID=A0A5F1ZSN3_9LEPT|nr:SDR family oxidoreductase [Leptospira langatensis]TGK00312.1 SDR family oxidoreductase [Leptospira langatensis]TGL41051.1 SDR family oxidoreductase [Leptospira langatensis]
MKRILVVGATGNLGRLVVSELKRKGYWIRVLARSVSKLQILEDEFDDYKIGDILDPKSMGSAFSGIDAVISCAGASLDLKDFKNKGTFEEINLGGNLNVLRAALNTGVSKFIYTSFLRAKGIQKAEYIRSHDRFSEAIRNSGIDYTIVRPTAFFSILLEFLEFAKKGMGIVIGNGKAKINPIHEKDVAKAVVEALESNEEEINIGGPDILTRDQITELALKVAGRNKKPIHIPIFLNRILIYLLRPFNRRIFQFMQFGNTVHTLDIVGPQYGVLRLEDYFREKSGSQLLHSENRSLEKGKGFSR